MEFKHFTFDEFDSPDYPGSGEKFMDREFLECLDEARDIAGIQFKINSGYRTPEHNDKVGGKPGSSHTKGLAVDIACNNSTDRFKLAGILREVGFKRIGMGSTFIHVDIDKDKSQNVLWTY